MNGILGFELAEAEAGVRRAESMTVACALDDHH
jgi:hypothetical protein